MRALCALVLCSHSAITETKGKIAFIIAALSRYTLTDAKLQSIHHPRQHNNPLTLVYMKRNDMSTTDIQTDSHIRNIRWRAITPSPMLIALLCYSAMAVGGAMTQKWLAFLPIVQTDMANDWQISIFFMGLIGFIVTGILLFFAMITAISLRIQKPLLLWRVEGSQWQEFASKHIGGLRFSLRWLIGLYAITSALAMIKQMNMIASAASLILAIINAFLCTFIIPYTAKSAAIALYKDCVSINGRLRRWGNRVLSVELMTEATPHLKILYQIQSKGGSIIGEDTEIIPVPPHLAAHVRGVMTQIVDQ